MIALGSGQIEAELRAFSLPPPRQGEAIQILDSHADPMIFLEPRTALNKAP